MNDLIDRQVAFEDLHRQFLYRMNQQGMKERLDEWLENLPSTQPKREAGTWEEREVLNSADCTIEQWQSANHGAESIIPLRICITLLNIAIALIAVQI